MEPPLLPAWRVEGTGSFQPAWPQEGSGGRRAACHTEKPQVAGSWPCRSPARGGPTSHNSLKAQGQGQVDPSESPPTKGRHRCPTLEGRGPTRPEFGMVTVQGAGSVEMVGPVLFLDSEAAVGVGDSPSAPGSNHRSAVSGQRVRHLLSPSLSPTELFKESAGRVYEEGRRCFPTSFRLPPAAT